MGGEESHTLRTIEDIYILEEEQKKYEQELHNYEEEMSKLLLEMAEIELTQENTKEGEQQSQEYDEKVAAILAINATKAIRYYELAKMKKANLEKQLQISKLQQDQSKILADISKSYVDFFNNIKMDSEDKESIRDGLVLTVLGEGEKQIESRKEVKKAILGQPEDNEEEEKESTKNPSKLMKLEAEAKEKIIEKIKLMNQTPTHRFWNFFKLKL